MKPLGCPECGAARHRLYYVWRLVPDGKIGPPVRCGLPGCIHGMATQEAWACRSCAHIGPWRLATAGTLALVTEHQKRAAAAAAGDAGDSGPSQVACDALEAMRRLFTDDRPVEDVETVRV